MFNYFLVVPIMLAFNLLSLFGSQMDPAQKLMHAVMNKTAKELNCKYGLSCCGNGSGRGKDDKIEMCSLSFQLFHTLTMEECRETIMGCAHQFLSNINNDPKLREHLSVYPFTYNNIDLAIYLSQPDRSDVYHPDIGIVTLDAQRGVNYKTETPEDLYNYKTDIKETFEEALQKLQDKRSGH